MMKRSLLLIGMMLIAAQGGAIRAEQQPQRPERLPSIGDYTNNTKKMDGYFPIYWDERTRRAAPGDLRGSIRISCSPTGLSAGLGSNDIGLDRGEGGGSRIVQFQRVGPRVMMVQANQSFRSSSKNPLERKSVEDSFAKSILWGFTIAAESNGRVLVDATDFFLRDHDQRRQLAAARHLSRGSHAQRLLPARTRATSRRTPKST